MTNAMQSTTAGQDAITPRKVAFDQIKHVELVVRNSQKALAGVPDRHWPEELLGTLNALYTVSVHVDKLVGLAEAQQRAADAQSIADFQTKRAKEIREGLREQADDQDAD